MTAFFIPMIPPTKTYQQHKIRVVNNKPVIYEPAELKAVRMKLEASLSKYAPREPETAGIRLITKWLYPTTPKHFNGEYRLSRPDTDNLQKMLKDVMTKLGFWIDDSLVASEIIEKFWADTPGIFIQIEALEERSNGT